MTSLCLQVHLAFVMDNDLKPGESIGFVSHRI